MRYFLFLLPLVTLFGPAGLLEWWRQEALRQAARTFDYAYAEFVSVAALLLLLVCFAGTTVWALRRDFTTYTVSILYLIVGVLVTLGGPVVALLFRDDATVGTLVSDHMVTSPLDSLATVANALLVAFGLILLMWEVFQTKTPPREETTP